jgi:DNA-binding GntR family transcriptional regulator
VIEAIREAILSGQLAPGDLLVEQEIAAQFGMSKTPVREALRLLSASGLVTLSTFKGASVRIVDEELMRSVYEIRAILEPVALQRSLRNVGLIDTELATSILAETAEAIDSQEYARLSLLNRRFHRIFYEKCGNPLLVEILDSLRDQTALISTVGWQLRSSYVDELNEHRKILDAVLNGRGLDEAAHLLREHIERFQEVVAPAVAAEASGAADQ